MKLLRLSICMIALMLTACSSTTPKNRKEKLRTSLKAKKASNKPKTIREKLREEAISRYARLRLQQLRSKWRQEELAKEARRQTVKRRRIRDKRHKETIVRRLPKAKPTPHLRRKILANPEELKIEVDQNLAYYCMAKSNYYKKPSDCQKVAKNALENCENKYDWDDRGLLRCVKSRLK